MQPVDCPAWDYKDYPNYVDPLRARISDILVRLRTGQLDTLNLSVDSRPSHAFLFSEMAPEECPYYAGHFRGEHFRCLKFYQVHVPSDPRVGFHSSVVGSALRELGQLVRSGLAALDAAEQLPYATLSAEDRILFAVTFSCNVLEKFLRIHPFADGNGHIGRLIIWCLLGRYGYWPVRWPIEPRPPDPPYSELIKRHRDGEREPLEAYVLDCIANTD